MGRTVLGSDFDPVTGGRAGLRELMRTLGPVGIVCAGAGQSIFSTSGNVHFFAKNSRFGPYTRNVSSNLRVGSVGIQFVS